VEHPAPSTAAAGLSHLPDFAAAVAFAAVAQVGAAAAAVSSVVDAFEG